MATVGPNRSAMQVVVEDTVPASASRAALGGQAPSGVGPPLSIGASIQVDGQHCPSDATRSNVARLPIPANTTSRERREVLQQMQVRVSPRGMEVLQQIHVRLLHAKAAGSTSTTTLDPHSPNAHRPAELKQPDALPANTPSHPQFSHINMKFAIPLALPDNPPLLQCSLWSRP